MCESRQCTYVVITRTYDSAIDLLHSRLCDHAPGLDLSRSSYYQFALDYACFIPCSRLATEDWAADVAQHIKSTTDTSSYKRTACNVRDSEIEVDYARQAIPSKVAVLIMDFQRELYASNLVQADWTNICALQQLTKGIRERYGGAVYTVKKTNGVFKATHGVERKIAYKRRTGHNLRRRVEWSELDKARARAYVQAYMQFCRQEVAFQQQYRYSGLQVNSMHRSRQCYRCCLRPASYTCQGCGTVHEFRT